MLEELQELRGYQNYQVSSTAKWLSERINSFYDKLPLSIKGNLYLYKAELVTLFLGLDFLLTKGTKNQVWVKPDYQLAYQKLKADYEDQLALIGPALRMYPTLKRLISQ